MESSPPPYLRSSRIITEIQVYFRIQWHQFDALLSDYWEPHIKKKTTYFWWTQCARTFTSALCCETKGWNLTIAISGFWTVALNCQKQPLKMLATNAKKRRKSNPIRIFFYDGWKFRRQCVNVIDTAWGRIYFQRAKILDSVCNGFSPCMRWSTMSSMKMDKKSWWHCTLHRFLSHLMLSKMFLMVCAHQKWI